MNMLVAALIFVILLIISLAHLIWSIGKTWPIRDEKLLAQTVVGTRDIEKMPSRFLTFGVALLTFASGVIALSLADPTAGGIGLTLLGVPLAAIYLARGVIGFLPWWAERTPEPNFRLNDKRVYSPLCLAVGIGFIILIGFRLV